MKSLSFNTQPPEGGWEITKAMCKDYASFNTQPPEGGWRRRRLMKMVGFLFQHTAARRRLDIGHCLYPSTSRFQHTAARRRLEPLSKALLHQVSQPRFR